MLWFISLVLSLPFALPGFSDRLLVKVESQKLIVEERDAESEIEHRKLWRTSVPDIYRAKVEVLEKVQLAGDEETYDNAALNDGMLSSAYLPGAPEFDPGKEHLWKKRTFYMLTPDDPMRLSLHKLNTGILSLNVAGYFETADSERCALRVKISPKSPMTRLTESSGQYTPRERIYYISSGTPERDGNIIPDTDLPFKLDALSGLRQFAISLHDDLGAGEYNLSFELSGGSKGILRFFFAEEAPFALKHGQIAVLNLFGPSNLKIQATDQRTECPLRIVMLTAMGEIKTLYISLSSVDDSGTMLHELNIPSGLSSIRIENLDQDEVGLRFYVDKTPEMSADEQKWVEVWPDIKTYMYFLCSPQKNGLEVLLPQLQDEGQTIRLAARLPADAGEWGPHGCSVAYQFLDDMGHEIQKGDFDIEAILSQDTSYYPGQFHPESPSEPVYRYMGLPQKAAVLRLNSERDVHFRFHRRLSAVKREVYVPEDYTSPENARLSGRRDRRSEWELLTPENRNDLARAGKLVRVETQQKLVDYPPKDEDESGKDEAIVLIPDDYDEKTYVLEPYQKADPLELERSTATYFRVPANEDAILNIINYDSPQGQATTDVQFIYRFPHSWMDSGIAQTYPVIAFFMDGERLAEFPVMSPQGRFIVPFAQTGVHRCRVEINGLNGKQPEFFVNQLPDDLTGVTLWKRRTVYALERDGSVTVSVVKPPRESVTLNVVCYYDNRSAEEDERYSVLVTIDGRTRSALQDQPSTQYTPLLREYSIKNQPSAAIYLDKEGVKPGQPQTFFVPLHDDILPGQHQIVFRLLSGRSVRMRFFIMRDEVPKERVRYWREAG